VTCCEGSGLVSAAEPEQRVDELRCGGEVDVCDLQRLHLGELPAVFLDGVGRIAERKLEVPERLDDPDAVQPHAELCAELLRIASVCATAGLATLPALQPGEPGQRRRELDALPGLTREPDRPVTARLSPVPS